MTALSPDSFERALAKFKQSLSAKSPGLADQFSITSIQDVQTTCLNIRDEIGKNRCLRGMHRIQRFIEAMTELGQSIEVFVNANDLVCFIWGPIKFLLSVAKTYIESFDKLLDVYEMVGDAIPGLLAYRSLLEKHPPLATVLEDYYSDILRFHEAALEVFTRSKWKKFFKSAWKTFDTEFQPIIQSLSHRRQLLESEKGSASLYEVSNFRKEMAARHDERKQELRLEQLEKHKWRLLHIKDKLEAANYQQDQEMAMEAREGSDSGTWIFKTPAFVKWASRASTGHDVLYVHGIPGAGKTTLIASVIKHLQDQTHIGNASPDILIAYFYVKHRQSEKSTHNSILRAILAQVVARDPVLTDHLFDEFASFQGETLRSTKKLETLLATALEAYRTSYIVVDGLDEAASGEAEKSLHWLLSLVRGQLKEPNASLRLLCSGQRDGVLDNLLSEYASVALDKCSEHEGDIREYCTQQSLRIRLKFGITQELQDEIISRVASQADSMFLYARIVLENLLSQTKVSRLKQEMRPDTFPDGIERAYERVVVRVLGEDAPVAEREDAFKILGWVTCAARPLRWREIQSLFCIDVEAGTSDYNDNRLRVSCKQLCGSLVDVHDAKHEQPGPDAIVTIVHGSARDYLLRRKWIHTTLEHAKAATFCFRYLASNPFHVNSASVSLYAKQGYYGMQDYAVQHCLHHYERSAGMESYPDVLQALMESARGFIGRYSLPVVPDLAKKSHSDIADFLSQLPEDKRVRDSRLTIGFRTLDIRTIIEQTRLLDLLPEEKEIVDNVYGHQAIYKCPKIWCDFFFTGFDEYEDRKKHIQLHDRPFRCREEDCFASAFGFTSQMQLEEHDAKHHNSKNEEVRFPKAARSAIPRDSLLDAAGRNDVAAMLAFIESGSPVDGWVPGNRRKPENQYPICPARGLN